LELLHKAVVQLADDDGWARLDTVGTYILTLAPDFDTRSYGHSKLSNLVTKSGQFEVRRDAAKFIFIRSLPFAENTPDDGDEIPF
jgi:hypothetical protein